MNRNLRNPELHRERMFRRDVLKWLDARGQGIGHEDKWTPGIADVSWAVDQREGWIELKCQATLIDFHRPWPYLLRPEQLPWLLRRQAYGYGNVCVLYRFTTNKYALDGSVSPVNVTGFIQMDPKVLAQEEGRGTTLMQFVNQYDQPIHASIHGALIDIVRLAERLPDE